MAASGAANSLSTSSRSNRVWTWREARYNGAGQRRDDKSSTVTVYYIVTATDLSTQRWHVFLEQGLAFAFQYAVELSDLDSWGLGLVGWLAGTVGAGNAADIDLDLFSLVGDADGVDAKVRELWLSIFKRLRSFDRLRRVLQTCSDTS
jgi:hypothetical protein